MNTLFRAAYFAKRITGLNRKFVDVQILPMFNDNYCFIVTDKVSNRTAVVDPGDG